LFLVLRGLCSVNVLFTLCFLYFFKTCEAIFKLVRESVASAVGVD